MKSIWAIGRGRSLRCGLGISVALLVEWVDEESAILVAVILVSELEEVGCFFLSREDDVNKY